jgi:hypothetical protein
MGLPHTWPYLNFLHLFCWEKAIDECISNTIIAKLWKALIQICGDDALGRFYSDEMKDCYIRNLELLGF